MSVSIVGVGELPQGRSGALSTMALHDDLAQAALRDAGLAIREVDAVLTVSPRADPYLIHAAALCEALGLQAPVALTLEAGGAAPAAMLEVARGLIEGGRAQTVLAVAADLPLGSVTRDVYVKRLAEAGPVHPDYERPFAPTVPSMFALVANAHMHAFGSTQDQLAAVALQGRRMAALHPNAHHREPLDLAAYRQAAAIADPLCLYDCAPVSDGGGAFVVTSKARAQDIGARSVDLLATGFATGHMHLVGASSLTAFTAGRALQQALDAAGLARSAIDVAMIYDCFTIAMIVNLEDLGFAERGRGGAAFAAGEFAVDGRLPVNTHGGLLSHGHPARAGGIGNLVEAVVQLRGGAGARQVKGARTAMVHGMGGVFATHAVALLQRA